MASSAELAKSPPNQVLLAYGVFVTAAWAVYHFVANGEPGLHRIS